MLTGLAYITLILKLSERFIFILSYTLHVQNEHCIEYMLKQIGFVYFESLAFRSVVTTLVEM